MFSRDDLLGAGTRTESMFSKLLNTSSRFVMEGVKNLVPKKHNLPITKVVDAIMDVKSNAGGTDDYRYFDPKLMRASERFFCTIFVDCDLKCLAICHAVVHLPMM
jgi:hypothetical protein